MVGDLNSEPDTGAIRYLASGQVTSSHPEWEAHAAFAWGDAVPFRPLIPPFMSHPKNYPRTALHDQPETATSNPKQP